ncbi:hypothetical protein Bca101_072950 [Brassica carinata]
MDLVVDDGAEPIQQQRKKQGEAISRIGEEKLGIRNLRFGINVTQRREATVEHEIGKRGKPRGPPPSAIGKRSRNRRFKNTVRPMYPVRFITARRSVSGDKLTFHYGNPTPVKVPSLLIFQTQRQSMMGERDAGINGVTGASLFVSP